ncbi:AroM protein [Serratia odorifera]|uniref:AroM protein n=1 Tax=Serratia odorifera TaxID=618 RepID=A0A447KLA1_SEROD|nr:AroM protein [Serratia odorifera]
MSASFATLTIGQAPRSDIMPLLSAYLPESSTTHIGLLDGLTADQVAARYAPQPGEKRLVTRLLDGSQVTLAAARVEQGLQQKIHELEQRGCEVILLLCTGEFGHLQAEQALLLEPDRIIPPLIAAIVSQHRVGIVVPVAEQINEQAGKWQQLATPPCFALPAPIWPTRRGWNRRPTPCSSRGPRWWCWIVLAITSGTGTFCRPGWIFRYCCPTYWSPSWRQS